MRTLKDRIEEGKKLVEGGGSDVANWKRYSKARVVALDALDVLEIAHYAATESREEHLKWWKDNGFKAAVEELKDSLRRNPWLA